MSPTGPDLPPGHLVTLRGRAPVWVHVAEGPPGAPVLMLLHGLGASAALNWFTAFEPLSKDFRVVAPDHRGHGRTPSGVESFTLGDCADDAFAVADALGVDRLIAVGYSMGGPIAQLMWRRQPNRVDGLVLAATSRDFGGRVRDRILFQLLPLVVAASRVPGYGLFRGRALSLFAPGSRRRLIGRGRSRNSAGPIPKPSSRRPPNSVASARVAGSHRSMFPPRCSSPWTISSCRSVGN